MFDVATNLGHVAFACRRLPRGKRHRTCAARREQHVFAERARRPRRRTEEIKRIRRLEPTGHDGRESFGARGSHGRQLPAHRLFARNHPSATAPGVLIEHRGRGCGLWASDGCGRLRAHFKPVARWLRCLRTFEKSDGCGDGCATAPSPWSGCTKSLPQPSLKWSIRSRRHRRSDCAPRAPSDTWRSERGNLGPSRRNPGDHG
jgi:hypothetical protein